MITTVGKAREEKWCPFKTDTGCCKGPECMMWCFWLPPNGIEVKTPVKHGIRDVDKKGYCGLTGRM